MRGSLIMGENSMNVLDRRKFLKTGGYFAALIGLGSQAAPDMADALTTLCSGGAPVLWLQGQSCSGCSISLLNSPAPSPASILTDYITLLFHSNLSAASGRTAVDVVEKTIEAGGYFLACEGSVPVGMPEACMMGEETFEKILLDATQNAQAVLAVGTCAAFGGIPAAEGNPTGAVSLPAFMSKNRVQTPVVCLPGCPAHPDWMVGTIAHIIAYGVPELDDRGRPTAYYGRYLHEQCPRFADYERERFAKTFSDDGCLFELGCAGPLTQADCTLRQWNNGVNSCIRANAPCIGCAAINFAKNPNLPLYLKK